MALLDSEIQRIRYELGFNVMGVDAEPYVTYFGSLNRVIQTYLNAGPTTTSSTSIVAATTPTQTTLVLASATGFSAGATVYVDVLPNQERAVIRSISGSSIVVFLQKAHAGTYPVTVDGGESMIREKLAELYTANSKILAGLDTAGLKRVDEIEFYGGAKMSSQATMLYQIRDTMRDELASMLGVVNLWRTRRMSRGQSFEVY